MRWSYASYPLKVTSTNEAGELTASFNAMVQELEQRDVDCSKSWHC